ncbi:30S ribosomal protein S2, partial [Rhizobium leguminosarum]|uniref:30S ribosomal protein S2 n=1 Tax=Rhizobium leguminosarum TaxID=384 RepID=UPI003F97954F
MLSRALQVVSDTFARGGRVLFVGTKRQASDIIADSAKRSAQYYVNSRWLGGMMTNWKTISNSIQLLTFALEVQALLLGEALGFAVQDLVELAQTLD